MKWLLACGLRRRAVRTEALAGVTTCAARLRFRPTFGRTPTEGRGGTQLVEEGDMCASRRLSLGVATLVLVGNSATSVAQTSTVRAKAAPVAEKADTPLRVRSAKKTAHVKVRLVKKVVAPARVRSTNKLVAPSRIPVKSPPKLFPSEEAILLASGVVMLVIGVAFKRRASPPSAPDRLSHELLGSGPRPPGRELPVLWLY